MTIEEAVILLDPDHPLYAEMHLSRILSEEIIKEINKGAVEATSEDAVKKMFKIPTTTGWRIE